MSRLLLSAYMCKAMLILSVVASVVVLGNFQWKPTCLKLVLPIIDINDYFTRFENTNGMKETARSLNATLS